MGKERNETNQRASLLHNRSDHCSGDGVPKQFQSIHGPNIDRANINGASVRGAGHNQRFGYRCG